MASPLLFMAGTVARRDAALIAAQIVELNHQGVDHTKVLRWKAGAWAHYMIDWPVTRLLCDPGPPLTVFAMDPFGRVHVAQGRDRTVEEVDASKEGPANRGVLRDMRWIAGTVVASGMQRQAYRRIGPGTWERFDQGAALPLGSQVIKSFDSIHGFGADDIYAVGLDGEIWHWDGKWRQLDSPTSAGLERVLCVPTGVVYAAGQSGMLMRGRGEAWTVIDSEGLRETISDLAWFGNRLFAASRSALHVVEGDRLVKIDIGLPGEWNFANLDTRDGILWSIGRTRMATTEDGADWQEVTCTDASY